MQEPSTYVPLCGLKREDFQTDINSKRTDLYFLRNNNGNEVAITNYGGTVVAVMMPDREGNRANIIQGHDNINDCINSPEPFLSTLVGRYAGRIANGKFQLRGKEYYLATNSGPNALHGGPKGFHARVWDALQMNDHALALNLTSAYGEEGYTGEVKVTVVYTLTDDDELMIEYLATTNKKTIVNLSFHGYFSLAGIADPTPAIDTLECEINADYYLPVDETGIPTGEIRFVKDTPFDFRQVKPIGRDIDADHEQIRHTTGYDHCFVLNKREEKELSFAARAYEPATGRTMEVYTTEPGLQLYSGNGAGTLKGQLGATFPQRSAVCFEAQHFPDSPNHPYFPSVILNPNRRYKQKTVYKFGVR